MKIITIYAIMCGDEIVSTTHKESDIAKFKKQGYKVVPCNGLIIV